MDFLSFATHCGPAVHPVTTMAIARAEASFDPLAVRNNTLKVTYRPRTLTEAAALVDGFAAKGHKLAIGVMQVTTPWAATYQIRPAQLLDVCTNIRVGTEILAREFAACQNTKRSTLDPLSCALSAYWSGSGSRGGAYANYVYRSAGSAVRVPETPGVTDGLLMSRGVRSGGVRESFVRSAPVPAGASFVPRTAGLEPRADGFAPLP